MKTNSVTLYVAPLLLSVAWAGCSPGARSTDVGARAEAERPPEGASVRDHGSPSPPSEVSPVQRDRDHVPAPSTGSNQAATPSPPATVYSDRAIARKMQEQFDNEPTDRAALSSGDTLRDAFTSPRLRNTKLDSLECRRRLCRLQVTFADHASDLEAFRVLFGPGPDTLLEGTGLGNFIVPERTLNSDGSITAILYIGRGSQIEINR